METILASKKFHSRNDYDNPQYGQVGWYVKESFEDGMFTYVDDDFAIEFTVGKSYTSFMSSPGYGTLTYKVTRITEDHVYGELVENNSGILTEADVR